MKRFLALMMIVILLLSGCSRKISNKAYAVRYDNIVYDLQVYMNDNIFYDNLSFFDYHNFNDEFSIRPFKASMEGLIEQIDEALYQLGTMGPDIKDAKIQQYQSKIEYALEDIRALVANYVELKTVTTIIPSQITLYNATFKLMGDLSDPLIQLKTYMDKLDAHIENDRNQEDENYHVLKEVTVKNNFRIYYAFGYLSAIMASYEEYTGLRNDPKRPETIKLGFDTYAVFELAIPVMEKVVDFGHVFMDVKTFDLDNMSNDMKTYYEGLQVFKERTDSYYAVRSKMAPNFFTADKFRDYIVIWETHKTWNKTYAYYVLDETCEEYEFKSLRLGYMGIKEIVDNQVLQTMLFNQDNGRIGVTTDDEE